MYKRMNTEILTYLKGGYIHVFRDGEEIKTIRTENMGFNYSDVKVVALSGRRFLIIDNTWTIYNVVEDRLTEIKSDDTIITTHVDEDNMGKFLYAYNIFIDKSEKWITVPLFEKALLENKSHSIKLAYPYMYYLNRDEYTLTIYNVSDIDNITRKEIKNSMFASSKLCSATPKGALIMRGYDYMFSYYFDRQTEEIIKCDTFRDYLADDIITTEGAISNEIGELRVEKMKETLTYIMNKNIVGIITEYI